jgi:hypothetical protein
MRLLTVGHGRLSAEDFIDMGAVTAKLLGDGFGMFAKSYADAIQVIASKADAVLAAKSQLRRIDD